MRDRAMIERELGGPFKIVETPVEVQRFDDLGLHPLVIKIDVEGLELTCCRAWKGHSRRTSRCC